MRVNRVPNTALLMGVVMICLPASLRAQSGAGPAAPIFGDVKMTYTKPGVWTPTYALFPGHVRMTSKNYDLSCETLTILSAKGQAGGRPVVTSVTAKPAAGGQVAADVRRPDALNPLNSQAFHVLADRAVYIPERSRPDGVRVDFTGHVQVITTAGFLDGPSVTKTDRFTLRLGQGDDYPQIETGPAEITATPAQQ